MKCIHVLCGALILVFGLTQSPCLYSQSPVTAGYDPEHHIWSISNGIIEAQYALNDQSQFRLLALRRLAGKEWVNLSSPVSSPINMRIDGKILSENTRWTMTDTTVEPAPRGGLRRVIKLRNDEAEAEITLRLEMHPGQRFLRMWYSYRNTGQTQHYVQRARFLNLRVNTDGRPLRAFYVNQVRQGAPLMFDTIEKNLSTERNRDITVFSGAYADQCTWLALRDDADSGLVFGWEFDGRSTVTVQSQKAGREAFISGGPLALHIPVAPAKEVTFPAAFVGLFRGDWDEAGYRTQRYVEAVLATPLPDDNFPYLMYDTWGYGQNIDETTLRRSAQIAAGIGVELFIVDLGWARQIGEWRQDPVKFPTGLRALSDYVHSLGMKFGLHFVPAEASASAPVLAANSDWTSSVNDDYFEAQSICLSNSAAQSWIRFSTLRIIRTYAVDWITQDGENLVKDCSKTTHTHDSANSNWDNSVNGIDGLVDFVRGQAPETLWENNADGGTMSTFGAVQRYVTFSSCDACAELPRRQAVYGMSYVFPPRYIDRYMGEFPTKFTTRSSMFGGPWILMQPLTQLSSAGINVLREEATLFKSIRSLIRDGKVFHLLPRPDGFSIEALESFRPDWNRGLVFVYRPDSPVTQQAIFPRGLNPNGNYRVSFQESRDSFYRTGASLMSAGITVNLPSKFFAEIVYITGQ